MKTMIEIIKPDDWHCHLRNGAVLAQTVPDVAARFARAIVMPNLQPAVCTVVDALSYRDEIIQVLGDHASFKPLMTLYLTEQTSVQEIYDAAKSPHIYACKLYPAGVTTNAEAGVQKIKALYPVFEMMQSVDLPLLIHGEVTNSDVDIFDRERIFIESTLKQLIAHFPKLRIVLEHISTKAAVEFITNAPKNIAATITAHHLMLNRNDLLSGGIKPHYYCLPIVKRASDQAALIQAATSANPKFFLGTDSAPHTKDNKQSACGCAGIYTANAAIELYAQAFEQAGALDKLNGFSGMFGADFYQLPRNQETITLIKQQQSIPKTLPFADDQLIPFFAGQTLEWSIAS